MSGEKVCEARLARWRSIPIGDAEGPSRSAYDIPCPPLDAPHPGCGAKPGEACRERRKAGLPCADPDACDPCRRGEHAPTGGDCGCICSCPCDDDLLRARGVPVDATPAVDVGDLRAEIERLRGRESDAMVLVRGLLLLALDGRDRSHRMIGLGMAPCPPGSMCNACQLIARADILAAGGVP